MQNLTENLEGRKWAEVRADYLCEDDDDLFWRVDAWETDDDNEEGKVIAYVDSLTGRVIYVDPEARWRQEARDVIDEKVIEVEGTLSEKAREYIDNVKRILFGGADAAC